MFHTDADKLNFLLQTEAELAELLADGDLSAEARAEERPKYITNYIGSKQKLIDWIWKATPESAKSAVDAFSGSSVVGYMYKTKGLAVQSFDRLAYCHHIARAIVENDGVTLSEEEIESLLAENGKARDFVRKHFAGVYFENDVLKLIDVVRSNIDGLSGYKKDIALFALGKTCITANGGFGHFGTTKRYDNADTPAEFKERFTANAKRISALVFEGQKSCKAGHGDTRKLLAKVEADVAYFDPPYATQFSQTNYERAYHFIEGLMTWWEGKEIQKDSKSRTYTIPTEVTKANAHAFFEEFLGAAKHIPHWIISYRDKAYPTEAEIKKIVAANGKSSRMKTREHQYHISAGHGENSLAKEHLFVCAPGKAKADFDDEDLSADGGFDEQEAFFLSLTADHDPDLLEALAAPKDGDAVRVTAFMGNKYFILDFLWKQTPRDAKSVLDAFSGGANVGYFYKKKGLRVVSNDKLHYPHHIARALIENGKETLSDEDIEAIFADNPKAGTFCAEHFHGYYFTKPILQFLDVAWANIQTLKGYKKDLALTALGWSVVAKAKFGQFSRSKKGLTGPVSNPEGRQTSLSNIPLSDFQKRFRQHLARVNKLVFDNGQENKATRLDAVEALKQTDCDLVYADPPYITKFGTNDYEMNLHFVEGLMTMWEGKELRDNARRDYESGTRYTRESIGSLIADIVRHAGGRHLMLSYRDQAYPDEATIHGFFKERFKDARVKGIEVEYAMIRGEPESGGKHAKELVFIGSEPVKAKAAASCERNVHTRITGQVAFETLEADAAKAGDKKFKFILTHTGTNRNGDHFTPEELKQAAETAVGRKVDLSHSQEFRDIVGGIVEARYVDDGENSRVECVGELFTEDSEPARLAYKLMKRGIVSHVSMECDYQEGECSVCGKRIKNKAEYCVHLKNYKGRTYQDKPVFEVLHGITFTGMGLLDREGADERAEIRQVASHNTSEQGDETMADEKDKQKKGAEDGSPDPAEMSDTEKTKLIKKQQGEIDRLASQVEELQRKLDEAEAARKANVRRTKAEKLLALWEEAGRDFGDETSRTAEIERLMKMSDDAFGATEETVSAFAAGKKKPKDEEDDPEAEDNPDEEDPKDKKKNPFAPKKKGKSQGDMKSDAGHRPHGSTDPRPEDLQGKLTTGFLAAYKDRAGITAGD
jgi:adenine-specific DNA-methyltransferase